MYQPLDAEFLSGSAYPGMPPGYNPDFDAALRGTRALHNTNSWPIHTPEPIRPLPSYDPVAEAARLHGTGCDFARSI